MNQPTTKAKNLHRKAQKNLKHKAHTLCEIEGLPLIDILEQSLLDGIAPGICVNANCDSVYYYEPDQTEGYCEECGTNSVWSIQELVIY